MDGEQPPPPGYPRLPGGKDGGTWAMGTPTAPPALYSDPERQRVPVSYAAAASAAVDPICGNRSASSVPASAVPLQTTKNNPYVRVSPVRGSGVTSETVCKALGRFGKKLEDTTKKAGDLAGNVWQHLRTGPSFTDAAMARLAQGTKILVEGGNDKVFQHNFGLYPGEQHRKVFACYLSTSSGPAIGTLYLSTLRLAFCSENPLYHYTPAGQQEWVYYKVVIQLDQLKAINSSSSNTNPSEKYIQIITSDNYEFWLMGFVFYDKALKNLKEALLQRTQ